jgi:outer membrane protein, heavy metal efflux system
VSIRLLLRAMACVTVVGSAGCQTYQSAPFDSSAFASAWRARSDTPSATGAGTGSTQPAAAGRTLNVAEAEAYALVFNPSLRLARHRAGIALARSDHAGLWDDPTLGVDVERILGSSNEPWVAGGTVNLTLPLSGRLEAEKARTSAAHHAELIRVAGEELAIRHRVRATWIEWSNQSARVSILNELLGRLEAINLITGKLAESGAISLIEGRVFRVERATRQAEQIAARARLAELRLQLLSLIGFTPDAGVDFSPAPHVNAGQTPAKRFDPEHSYDVRIAAAEYEVAERALKREIQAQYPDLVIGPGFGTDEGDERALLGLSLPLPLWNRNQQAIATARAERELAKVQLETAIEQAASAHAIAWLQLISANERKQLHLSSIVPTADEQAGDAQRLAELGEVNAVLLLDAFVRQYEARLALLDATQAESLAANRLDELSGEPPSTKPARAARGVR